MKRKCIKVTSLRIIFMFWMKKKWTDTHLNTIAHSSIKNYESLCFQDSLFDAQFKPDVSRKSTSVSSNMKKASSSTNIDDLSSIFGGRIVCAIYFS